MGAGCSGRCDTKVRVESFLAFRCMCGEAAGRATPEGHSFTEPGQEALKLLPLARPPWLSGSAQHSKHRGVQLSSPNFVAKHLLQQLIGPHRWGEHSPLICELGRAQRFIHKSVPTSPSKGWGRGGGMLGRGRSHSCRTLRFQQAFKARDL